MIYVGESIYGRDKIMNKSITGMTVLHSEISISFSNVSLVVAVSKRAKFAHFILLDYIKRAEIAYFET